MKVPKWVHRSLEPMHSTIVSPFHRGGSTQSVKESSKLSSTFSIGPTFQTLRSGTFECRVNGTSRWRKRHLVLVLHPEERKGYVAVFAAQQDFEDNGQPQLLGTLSPKECEIVCRVPTQQSKVHDSVRRAFHLKTNDHPHPRVVLQFLYRKPRYYSRATTFEEAQERQQQHVFPLRSLEIDLGSEEERQKWYQACDEIVEQCMVHVRNPIYGQSVGGQRLPTGGRGSTVLGSLGTAPRPLARSTPDLRRFHQQVFSQVPSGFFGGGDRGGGLNGVIGDETDENSMQELPQVQTINACKPVQVFSAGPIYAEATIPIILERRRSSMMAAAPSATGVEKGSPKQLVQDRRAFFEQMRKMEQAGVPQRGAVPRRGATIHATNGKSAFLTVQQSKHSLASAEPRSEEHLPTVPAIQNRVAKFEQLLSSLPSNSSSLQRHKSMKTAASGGTKPTRLTAALGRNSGSRSSISSDRSSNNQTGSGTLSRRGSRNSLATSADANGKLQSVAARRLQLLQLGFEPTRNLGGAVPSIGLLKKTGAASCTQDPMKEKYEFLDSVMANLENQARQVETAQEDFFSEENIAKAAEHQQQQAVSFARPMKPRRGK